MWPDPDVIVLAVPVSETLNLNTEAGLARAVGRIPMRQQRMIAKYTSKVAVRVDGQKYVLIECELREGEAPTAYHYRVDQKRFTAQAGLITASRVRERARVGDGWQLWLERPDDPDGDTLLHDQDDIELDPGGQTRFYTFPQGV